MSSHPQKLDGNVVIHSCYKCQHFAFPQCSFTGEFIFWPISGPVGINCLLPDFLPDPSGPEELRERFESESG